jgi:SAM-dependent methyltransferase
MNRDRGLFGRDGYGHNLGVDPLAVLTDRLAADRSATVRWLDLCCGSGTALLQAAQRLDEHERVEITGVDLVDFFAGPPPGTVRFVTASVTTWRPDRAFDLITCVHGLHYVGDKLAVLAAAASWLTSNGVLVANFDATGIRLPDGPPMGRRLTASLREAGFISTIGTRLAELLRTTT